MKVRTSLALLTLALTPALLLSNNPFPPDQNWTNYVRIAAWSLGSTNAQQIVDEAKSSHVFGIEVDNDIPGRYESFLHPEEKLRAITAVAEKAHQAGNRAFVYIAGTECITANADKTPHTLAKDHPDWLQRKITGEPAIFGGGTAFWIAKGDEDVWISPYAQAWRKIYMERVRQIAATGIDGIYVDIPYWMTHFDGWENSWASFDDYTVAAFREQTGLDVKRDLKLGDFSDPNFRKWVDFRIRTITEFIREIDLTAKSVNPEIKTIPEIYPGIEEEAVRVGADVYSLYPVSGAIAHEYEFGNGDHMASSRTPLDWFRYQVGMQSFRAFAEGKATWILNYSWDGDKSVDARPAMQSLFLSQIIAGANPWDARGHVMSGSNDLATRKQVFSWIEAHEQTFFRPRDFLRPVGVYFSPQTRNYFTQSFLRSYQGVLILLMQEHREYQIVTPRTLKDFRGPALVLPDVQILEPAEQASLRDFVQRGGTLVTTGADTTGIPSSGRVLRFADCPGKAYLDSLEKSFASTAPAQQQKFLDALPSDDSVRISASPRLVTHIARVDGKLHIFFGNLKQLRGQEDSKQGHDSETRVSVAGTHTANWLPFLGDARPLAGQVKQGRTEFVLPAIDKGAVLWID